MKFLVILILWVMAQSTLAANEKNKECEAAVDAADSMNVNQKGCDYTNEGLNGFLHRAFKKNPEQTSSPAPEANDEPKVASAKGEAVKNKLEISLTAEFDQWTDSSAIRTSLLPKAMAVCEQGFRVISETYKPVAKQKFKLSLYIQCIE